MASKKTRIQLHNFTVEECKTLGKQIKDLKGVYVNSQHFQRNVSHLICRSLTVSEKFLAACVTGCWVVSPAFVENSHSVGHWLEEEDYQFSVSEQPADLVSAYKRWHWKVRTFKELPFTGWQVALLLAPEKLLQLRRVLMFGDAHIVHMAMPLKTSRAVPQVTYVVMDDSSQQHVSNLAEFGLLCISFQYILDFLLKDTELNVFDYIVTADANPPPHPLANALEDNLSIAMEGSNLSQLSQSDGTLNMSQNASVHDLWDVSSEISYCSSTPSVSYPAATRGRPRFVAIQTSLLNEPEDEMLLNYPEKSGMMMKLCERVAVNNSEEEIVFSSQNKVVTTEKGGRSKSISLRPPISDIDPNVPVVLQQKGRKSKRKVNNDNIGDGKKRKISSSISVSLVNSIFDIDLSNSSSKDVELKLNPLVESIQKQNIDIVDEDSLHISNDSKSPFRNIHLDFADHSKNEFTHESSNQVSSSADSNFKETEKSILKVCSVAEADDEVSSSCEAILLIPSSPDPSLSTLTHSPKVTPSRLPCTEAISNPIETVKITSLSSSIYLSPSGGKIKDKQAVSPSNSPSSSVSATTADLKPLLSQTKVKESGNFSKLEHYSTSTPLPMLNSLNCSKKSPVISPKLNKGGKSVSKTGFSQKGLIPPQTPSSSSERKSKFSKKKLIHGQSSLQRFGFFKSPINESVKTEPPSPNQKSDPEIIEPESPIPAVLNSAKAAPLSLSVDEVIILSDSEDDEVSSITIKTTPQKVSTPLMMVRRSLFDRFTETTDSEKSEQHLETSELGQTNNAVEGLDFDVKNEEDVIVLETNKNDGIEILVDTKQEDKDTSVLNIKPQIVSYLTKRLSESLDSQESQDIMISQKVEKRASGVMSKLQSRIDSHKPRLPQDVIHCGHCKHFTFDSLDCDNHIGAAGCSKCNQNCIEDLPLTFPFNCLEKPYDSTIQPVPRLLEQCIEASVEMDCKDIALIHSQPCSDQAPTAGLIKEMVKLTCSEEPHIYSASSACLHDWLNLHPPVTDYLKEAYCVGLNLTNTESFLRKCLEYFQSGVDLFSGPMIAVMEFVVSVLELDFKHCLKSPNRKELQNAMIVKAVWGHSHAVCYNDSVREILLAFRNTLSFSEEDNEPTSSQNLLISLITMVAHCLHLSSVQWQPSSPVSLNDNNILSLANELSRNIKDTCQDTNLASMVSRICPSWLRILVVSTILSTYNDYLLTNSIRVASVTLPTIMFQFLFLLPPLQEANGKTCDLTRDRQSTKRNSRGSSKSGMSPQKGAPVSPSKCPPDSPEKVGGKSTVFTTAKVNKRNGKGEAPLHVAAIRKDAEKIKMLLQVPGVDVNIQDHAGWTPLHEACNHGSTACVELLLKYVPVNTGLDGSLEHRESVSNKVDINARGIDGMTPLHDAVVNEMVDICKLLLKYGGSKILYVKNDLGFTALDMKMTDNMKALLLSFDDGGQSSTSIAGYEPPTDFLYKELFESSIARSVDKEDYINFITLATQLVSSYASWRGLSQGHVCGRQDEPADMNVIRAMKTYLKMFLRHVKTSLRPSDFEDLEFDLMILCSISLKLMDALS